MPGYFATNVCLSESNPDNCELKSVSFFTTSVGSPAAVAAAVCPVVDTAFLAEPSITLTV